MRVAVLSDIHGNMQALEAVMDDIKEYKCEKVFCLGDLAMAGPQPRMVIDYVQKQDNWTVIQGNTDKMIADFSSEIMETTKNNFPVMANALVDDVYYLEDERKEYLRNLPPQKFMTVDGVKVLLVHGSPRRNNEDILPNMPLKEVEEMLEGVDADLIFCGHTHIPAGYQTNKKQTVVNVGSVGNSFDVIRNKNKDSDVLETTKSNYLIIEGEYESKEYSSEISFQFIKIPYNIDKELEDEKLNIEKEDYRFELKEGMYRDMSRINDNFRRLGMDVDKI